MELPRFEKDVSSKEVAQALGDAGCAVIEQLVDDELMDRVASEVEPFVESTPFGDRRLYGEENSENRIFDS